MTGTFGGALEARGINASNGDLTSTTVGEVELEGKVLVVKRIHVTYHLAGAKHEDLETIERVHGFHADKCPVARSIRDAIDITTEFELVG
ncbi:MAG: OsmC family protein [Acidimicrobiia bacterium]|nr:OsmC family protein [Acidimicrobiia bacterium]MDH3470425.1 OsmC family protein [Acidimicrobiia bacterium]